MNAIVKNANASTNVPNVSHLTLVPQDPLIEALRSRSRRAASELHRRFAPSMLAMAKKRVPRDDADDIVQDAFLMALRAPSYPETLADLERWLHGLLFRAIDARRRTTARENLVDAVQCLLDRDSLEEQDANNEGDYR